MGLFLIEYDAGYGNNCEVIDAESQRRATQIARGKWEKEFIPDYQARKLTDDLAKHYHIELRLYNEGQDT